MAKRNKTAKMNDETVEGIGPTEPEADVEDFEFDSALMLEGIEVVDLSPDFIRPEGFLMIPRLDKKTGEISPQTATFYGILNDVIKWKDKRGKDRFWLSCIATATVADSICVSRPDNDDEEDVIKPVEPGDCVGISGTGAIAALRTKKGYFVALHWTGRKIESKNGAMWEIIAQISKQRLAVEMVETILKKAAVPTDQIESILKALASNEVKAS